MCWFNPMGPNYQCHVGVSHLLPWGHTVPSMYHHTGAVDHPFPGRSLGRHGKALSRYGILLIALSLGVRCKWVFRLTAMWTHSHQIHPLSLVDVAWKLLLLADEGADWPYAYIRMNDSMAHALLSSVGHIGIMTGDLPRQNTCSCLHRLCMWHLLQCRGWMVCPDGINGGLEPLVFSFKELSLWNVTNTGESSRDPSMMDVDLGDVVHAALPSTQVEDPLSLSSRRTMEQLPLASLAIPTLPHNTLPPGHKLHQWPWEFLPQQGKQRILLNWWEQNPSPWPQW